MLNSLYIKNYRNLKKLQIDSVGQVNLICGKNNTGKTSILEAIYIYTTKASGNAIAHVLSGRGEFQNNDYQEESIIELLPSVFYNENIEETIQIGNCKEGKFYSEKGIELQLVRYIYEEEENIETGEIIKKKKNIPFEQFDNYSNSKIGLDIKIDGGYFFVDEKGRILGNTFKRLLFFDVHFVTARAVTPNEILFDRISLSDKKKKSVIDALKIIEEKINNLSYIADKSNEERKPKVTFEDSSEIKLLSRMGDGIRRILTIVLSMVNCENGYLLIDEFENGLHYSVQEQLWKIIFKLAKDLNIQVFATTHSNDCIHSFSKVLNEKNNEVSGKLIRLDNKNGEITPEIFSPEELTIATEQYIEIR
ncbi:hypothetical protein FACS189437_01960 [Bacteroidia bacterium]|nr:hypothetical protein FACS189437_01960 [Bacteroidia bacterium]